ncbi:MAG: acyl-CoA thioesterase [Neomegalonema sp.]|nr:acyl-CoA thioesterase [Neomegalonema sp.]
MTDRKTLPTRDEYVDFYPLQTRWIDNDIYGHMNNVVHYSLFDTAVNGWLMERGLLDPRGSESYGLVVETGCRYHAEMAFPDKVVAGLRVARLGSSSVRYEVGLFRNEDQTAAAEGFFVHVYVARADHRPTPIDDNRRAALTTLMRATDG